MISTGILIFIISNVFYYFLSTYDEILSFEKRHNEIESFKKISILLKTMNFNFIKTISSKNTRIEKIDYLDDYIKRELGIRTVKICYQTSITSGLVAAGIMACTVSSVDFLSTANVVTTSSKKVSFKGVKKYTDHIEVLTKIEKIG